MKTTDGILFHFLDHNNPTDAEIHGMHIVMDANPSTYSLTISSLAGYAYLVNSSRQLQIDNTTI